MATTQILVVDDSAPWRLLVSSIIERSSSLRVVGEASDGVEAIEKTATLHPDVVILDIGMPRLNGIEAAKKIRQASPKSKIIFLTQETDSDVRSVALNTGAAAYLLKSTAAGKLHAAIEQAMRWKPTPDQPDHLSPEPAILSPVC
jgi:DNA-binding NarL/FixJ family response regulator